MKIDVIPVYGKVLSNHISSCTVIVVDVLRSTSCIITAVGNGATKVVPAIDPGEAAMLASRLGAQDVVLAGEREAVKLRISTLATARMNLPKKPCATAAL